MSLNCPDCADAGPHCHVTATEAEMALVGAIRDAAAHLRRKDNPVAQRVIRDAAASGLCAHLEALLGCKVTLALSERVK